MTGVRALLHFSFCQMVQLDLSSRCWTSVHNNIMSVTTFLYIFIKHNKFKRHKYSIFYQTGMSASSALSASPSGQSSNMQRAKKPAAPRPSVQRSRPARVHVQRAPFSVGRSAVGSESDPRFSSALSDPKFRRMESREQRVLVDDRFAAMFTDERFVSTSTCDKRGRLLPKRTEATEQLHKYYQLSSSSDLKESLGNQVC